MQPEGVLALGDAQSMWFSPVESSDLSLCQGDVVVVEGGVGGYGRAAYLDDDLAGWGFQNSINRIRPRGENDGRFITYCLIAARQKGWIKAYCNVVSMPHLTAEKLGALRLPLPPPGLQRRIADYLDRETAKIDTLVTKQRQLIETLRERRAAIIAHAVTKGLDPHAIQVDSGIDWLGVVPALWATQQIKHFGVVTLGKMLQSEPRSERDVAAGYLRAANVQPDGELALQDTKTMWFAPDEVAALTLRRGDVIVVEGGIGGYGRAAFLSDDLAGVGFQNSINRIRPSGLNDGRYLAYFLIMARQVGYIASYCNIVSMPHLTAGKLEAIRIPVPPTAEQCAIADRLDEQTAKIDALIQKAQEFIELSLERRSALISAAVTGQIDVGSTAESRNEPLATVAPMKRPPLKPDPRRAAQIAAKGGPRLGNV